GERLHDLHRVWTRDVRSDLRQVERDLCGITCSRISTGRVTAPPLDIRLGEAFDTHCLEPLMHSSQILHRDFVDRKPSHDGSPLCSHVGNGKSRVHRERDNTWACELHCSITV